MIKAVYTEMSGKVENDSNNTFWLTKLKHMLEDNGFAEVWIYPGSVNVDLFIPVFKRRLLDNFLVEVRTGLNICTSMVLYRELCQDFEISPYLIILNNRKYRNSVTKLRLSSHQLLIETGRHRGIERQNRKCSLCTKNDIEDEFHFVLICPFYQQLRTQYISRYYYSHPSMLKFVQLLNSSGNTLKRLSIYITKAFAARNVAFNDILEK